MNIKEDELLYAIAFSMLTDLSERQKNKILHFYGSATDVYNYRKQNKADWPLKEAELELKFIDKHSIQCLTILDKNYPNRLIHTQDPPLILYVKGSDHFQLPQLISIVGTRQHTIQVKKVIHELLEGLQHLNMGVISGLALGIDGIAHEAALHFKLPTWGVLAHGLDQIYPNQHRRLAINMLQNNGGLITECRQKTITMPFQFPRRNRIVAGISDITIVIESAMEGGSMITAKHARAYNREVFAVPGKIHDAKSKGCLWLIKENIADMYFDAAHLINNMNWPAKQIIEHKSIPKQASFIVDPTAQSIYQFILQNGPVHKDAIASALAISNSNLAGYLMDLELNGHIHLQVGNLYITA